jgi:Ca2+-binding RTX toxin-like protein
MNASGGDQTQLTFNEELDDRPVFSPNSRQIAYSQEPPLDPEDVFVMRAGGAAQTNITNLADIRDESPDWQPVARCGGERATIVGDQAGDRIRGTKKADVIVANDGADRVSGRGGRDRICGGKGKDTLRGGKGRDLLIGGKGRDELKGGKGRDQERQ